MFAWGQSRRFRDVGCESALPPRTDIVGWVGYVGPFHCLLLLRHARVRMFRYFGCNALVLGSLRSIIELRIAAISNFHHSATFAHLAPRPLRARTGLLHRSKRIFDHRVGMGGQPCFAEILGSALISTQCWTNAATIFEAYMSDDDDRTAHSSDLF